jgi:uncharacterized lipoprotein YajG
MKDIKSHIITTLILTFVLAAGVLGYHFQRQNEITSIEVVNNQSQQTRSSETTIEEKDTRSPEEIAKVIKENDKKDLEEMENACKDEPDLKYPLDSEKPDQDIVTCQNWKEFLQRY